MNEIIIVIIVTICTIIEYFLSNKNDIYVGFFLGLMLSVLFLVSPFAYHTSTKTYNLVVQEKDDYCSYYTVYPDSVYIIKDTNEKEKEEYLNIDNVQELPLVEVEDCYFVKTMFSLKHRSHA